MRGQVKEILSEWYGEDRVVSIGTVNRMGVKQAIRDVATYLGVEREDSNAISRLFDDIVETEELKKEEMKTWSDFIGAVKDQETLKSMMQQRPRLFEIAEAFFGVSRQSSEHAAGVIVSSVPVSSYLPVRLKKGEVVTQFDMRAVERLGFLKADILGLRTLETLQKARDLVQQRHSVFIDFYKFGSDEYDDGDIWDMLGNGDTFGVFQAECLAEGTLIQGVPIEELYVNPPKTLRSVDLDTMEIVENEVVAVYDAGVKDIYEVCVGKRIVRCGEHHPFFTASRGWVEAKDLKEDDEVYWDTQEMVDRRTESRRNGAGWEKDEAYRQRISDGMKKAHSEGRGGKGYTLWKEQGKPNPRKGKRSGAETRKRYSERQKSLWKDPEYREKQTAALNLVLKSEEWREACRGREPRGSGRSRGGIRRDLGHFCRSSWEANVARVYRWQGIQYEHEPSRYVFSVNGVRTGYTPDFILADGTHIEVKGYWWPGYREKFEQFRRLHPEIKVELIEKVQYLQLKRDFSHLIDEWEDDGLAVQNG